MRTARLLLPLVVSACAGTSGTDLSPSSDDVPRHTRIETHSGTYEAQLTPSARTSVHTIDAPLEEAWSVLADAFAELGLEVGVIDPTRRILGVQGERVPARLAGKSLSQYLDCGRGPTGPNANTHDVVLTLLAQLRPAGAITEVEVRLEAYSKPRAVSGNLVQCATKGQLEHALVQRIKIRTAP